MATSGGGVSLDGAYDFSSAGGGRTITVDSGPVRLGKDGTNVSGLEMTDGQSLAVSAASEGRLRYNAATNRFQISENGGAFANIAVGAGGVTLDGAYDFGGAGVGRTITVDTGAVQLDNRQTSGTVEQINVGAATVLVGALTGISVDLSANVTPGANAINGISISIPATSRASTAGEGAIVIDSQATSMIAIDIAIATTSMSNGAIRMGWRAATVLVADSLVQVLNCDTNVIAGANRIRGYFIQIGTGTAPNSSAFYAVLTTGYRGIGCHIDSRQAVSTLGLFRASSDSANILSGAYRGVVCDLSTNVTPGANEVSGVIITIPATSRAATAGEGAFVINSDATAARVLDIDIANTSGVALMVRYGAAAVWAGTVTGLQLNFSTNVTPGANAFTGVLMNVPASTAPESTGLNINSSLTTATGAILAGTIKNTQGGAIQITYGGATALGGAVVAIDLDLATSVTPGANAITALRFNVAATTRADGAAEGAIVITDQATRQRTFDIDIRKTSGTFMLVRYGAATVLSADITGISLSLASNVTAGANGVTAYACTLPDISGDNPATIVSAQGANAQGLFLRVKTELHTLAAAATSDTTILFPANTIGMIVAVRVTTAVTTSAATNTFSVGVPGATTRYGSGISGGLGTTNKAPGSADYTSATAIRFSAPGAETFTAGVIRVTMWYWDAEAPSL